MDEYVCRLTVNLRKSFMLDVIKNIGNIHEKDNTKP